MPGLIENGYIYVARPPLYRVSRKKVSKYIHSEREMDEYLLTLGLSDCKIQPIKDQVPYEAEDAKLMYFVEDASANQPDEIISQKELEETIQKLIANLDYEKRIIMERRYGLGEFKGEKTQTCREIGEFLEKSAKVINDIELKILRNLREKTFINKLREEFLPHLPS